MPCIQCKHLSYTYSGSSVPVFTDVTLDIVSTDRIALIGRNGTGKTTLLRIMLGELHPDSGSIVWPREKPVVGYLPQDFATPGDLSVLEALYMALGDIGETFVRIGRMESRGDTLSPVEKETLALSISDWYNAGGAEYEENFHDILGLAGLEAKEHALCETLSGGEKTRLALGGLLLKRPDLLVLDEPTNHLDSDMMDWLEEFVDAFPGPVLYVSHDRRFIDNTATKIVEIVRGKSVTRNGNYSEHRKLGREEFHHQQTQFNERNRLIGRLREASQKRRQWASSFQQQTGAEGGGHAYESVYNAARTQMQQAVHIEQRISMLETRHPVEKPWIDKERRIGFTDSPTPSECLVTVKGLCFQYGECSVFSGFDFILHRGERIHLAGENGVGKTTLMRLIIGQLQPDTGEIIIGNRVRMGFYDQEFRQMRPDLTVMEWLGSIGGSEARIRTLLGCLGVEKETVFQKIGSLSEGEKAKTALSALLLGENNLLLLDEPTNHLDIPTREMLEKALVAYEGAILFVSHDRSFVDHVATGVVRLTPPR